MKAYKVNCFHLGESFLPKRSTLSTHLTIKISQLRDMNKCTRTFRETDIIFLVTPIKNLQHQMENSLNVFVDVTYVLCLIPLLHIF